jgi:hypothetical protein
MLDPTLNQALRTNGEAVWFGWPSDDRLEELRAMAQGERQRSAPGDLREARSASPVLLCCGRSTPNDGEEGWLKE